jgi:hypothetical protein
MPSTLITIVSCDILGLEKNTFSKAINMLQIDEFFCKDLTYVYIKNAQGDLQKCII